MGSCGKKGKYILLFLGGFLLGVTAAVALYFLTVGEIAWQVYVETKLIPNIVLALSAISAFCVAALPLISKVQSSVSKFNQATKDVNNTAEKGKMTQRALEKQEEKLASFEVQLCELQGFFSAEIASVRAILQNTEQIMRIGFCNTEELVKKGYAKEIEKVGAVVDEAE